MARRLKGVKGIHEDEFKD